MEKSSSPKRRSSKMIIIIIILLVLIIGSVVIMINIFANEKEYVTSDDVQYYLNDDETISISKYIGDKTDLVIDEIDGYKVSRIDDWAFSECEHIKSIIISDDVIHIGDYAFFNSSNLEEIKLPNNLKTLSYGLFYGCSSLTSISIPKSVEVVEGYSFYNCISLKSIVVPKNVKTIGKNSFLNCNSLESLNIPVVDGEYDKKYLGYFFGAEQFEVQNNCVPKSLKNVTIDGLEVVGKYVFQGLEFIENIVITIGTKEIEDEAFKGCIGLKNLSLPNSVFAEGKKSVYDFIDIFDSVTFDSIVLLDGDCVYEETFKNIESKTIVLPDTIKTISKSAFESCEIESIKLPEGLIVIDEYAFKGASLMNLELPNSLQIISNNAFEWCYELKQLVLGENIKSIGEYAFSYCSDLENLEIPKAEEIGRGIVLGCDELVSLTLPFIGDGNEELSMSYNTNNDSYPVPEKLESLTILHGEVLGEYALCRAKSLREVILPNELEEIKDSAFLDCDKLEEISIVNNLKKIGESAFYSCNSLSNFIFPNSLEEIGDNAFCDASNLKTINLPNSLISIGSFSFAACSLLEEVVVPNSVSSIEYGAFANTNIRRLTVPFIGNGVDNYYFGYIFGKIIHENYSFSVPETLEYVEITSLTSVSDDAFRGLNKIKEIVLPEGVLEIGVNAFYMCEELTTINIPSTVKTIKNYAFSKCSDLANVVLPENLETIENYVFDSCFSINEIIIPLSVTNMGECIFFQTYNINIYCRTNVIPSGWSNDWSYGCENVTITWDYKL